LGGHIFIIGPGRSGTTWTWELFRELGADTGTEAEFFRKYNSAIDAGDPVEYPHILKGTGGLCVNFERYLERSGLSVEHVIFCVRSLEPMIASHMKMKFGRGQYEGMTKEELREHLPNELCHTVGAGLLAILPYPHTILRFPNSAQDLQYALNAIYDPFFGSSIPQEEFVVGWRKVTKPHLIRNG